VVLILEGRGTTLPNLIFSALNDVERGMRDSTPATIRALVRRHGGNDLRFVEPSSAVRALGYVVGWPGGPARPVAWAIYTAATAWERVLGWLLPRERWVYMLAVLRRQPD
jgi:hypothetical protein